MPSKDYPSIEFEKSKHRDISKEALIVEDDAKQQISVNAPTQEFTPKRILWVSVFTSVFCLWPVGLTALAFSLAAIHSQKKHPRASIALNSCAYMLNVLAFLGGIGVLIYLLVEFIPWPQTQQY